MTYKLLNKFRDTFLDGPYRHRDSSQGDAIANYLFEDIFDIGRSQAFIRRVDQRLTVVNIQNKRTGITARRGDGTLGQSVPNSTAEQVAGFHVWRGPIATIEIGVEVKILAKAMIKQIDRVIGDLSKQVTEFRSRGGNPLSVGVVGINNAPTYLSFEGEREWPTTGKAGHRHPFQEAAEAERRLIQHAAPHFDEFLILHFVADNQGPPFTFSWVNQHRVEMTYAAALARLSGEFQARWP